VITPKSCRTTSVLSLSTTTQWQQVAKQTNLSAAMVFAFQRVGPVMENQIVRMGPMNLDALQRNYSRAFLKSFVVAVGFAFLQPGSVMERRIVQNLRLWMSLISCAGRMNARMENFSVKRRQIAFLRNGSAMGIMIARMGQMKKFAVS